MSANSENENVSSANGGKNLDLTAFALNQLDETERAEIERQLAEANGDGGQLVELTRRLADKVREVLAADNPAASAALRETLIQRMGEPGDEGAKPVPAEKQRAGWLLRAAELIAAALVLVLMALLFWPERRFARESARHPQSDDKLHELAMKTQSGRQVPYTRTPSDQYSDDRDMGAKRQSAGAGPQSNVAGSNAAAPSAEGVIMIGEITEQNGDQPLSYYGTAPQGTTTVQLPTFGNQPGDKSGGGKRGDGQTTPFYAGVQHGLAYKEGQQGGAGQGPGIGNMQGQGQGVSPNVNFQTYQRLGGRKDGLPIGAGSGEGQPDPRSFGGMMAGMGPGRGAAAGMDGDLLTDMMGGGMFGGMTPGSGPGAEQYAPIVENTFIPVQGIDALSTFSIDVDTASYANVRRFLTQGQLPPPNAVRVEELVNYFGYDYPQPKAGEPFSANMEVAECPWQQKHLLLRVGLKGREIHHKERPVSNLVFLLDVSGSMSDQNKLPLVKQVLSMMVRELREDDRVSIVTYAGEAGIRLPPTAGDQQERILQAINSLSAGGSTNGSAGIDLAYEQAQAYFRKEGTNRVILATDGDLNVGITDDESLVRMIKEKAAGGVFLTVLGFGEGNLKDAKMERLADNGNGLFAYIDSVREGRKVLVEQMSGSLVTIAKDVKIQIEFNPAQVRSYRLIGYENRMLTAPEFSDDKRDAGEIGAGHTVTALYELVPTRLAKEESPGNAETPKLRYQAGERVQDSGFKAQEQRLTEAADSGELLTLKLRYKEPDGMASKLSEFPLKNRGGKFNAASKDFQFAAAVASFGMHLRNSQFRGEGNLAAVGEIAASAIGEDKGGYRAEFVDLVRKAQQLRPVAGGPVNTDY